MVCVVLLAMLPGEASAATEVQAVRVGLAPGHVRLVLESSAPIQARVAQSSRPGALVIDLDDVAPNTALTQLAQKIGTHNPYLKSVTISHGQAGSMRMELISLVPVTPQIFNLKPGDGHDNRLVMDIYPDQLAPPSAQSRAETTAPAAATSAESVTASTAPVPSVPVPQAPTSMPEEMWLEVHVNDELAGTALVLRDAAHRLLVRNEDLQQWRIHVTGAATRHDADSYYPLDAIKGLTYRIDESRQSLMLNVSAELFDATQLSGLSRNLLEPTPSPPGAYLNYDISANRSQQGGMSGGAFVESGIFGRWGNGSNTVLARHFDGRNQVTRLDTTWTYDRPEKMQSLRFGDDISGTSSWGRSVRFGGMQWATSFATQPSFITFPMPTLGGTAATPSTVDFYVNNVLRLKRDVPSGPFSIQDLPVVTGQGEIRLVVRDLLGREQTVSQPFYASGGLLAAGLRDYSYEAGFERENYALHSNDYGRFIAVGTERRGFSDTFTGELHAELLREQQTIGAGGTYLWSTVGVMTAAVAASHDAAGSGGLVSLGFQHQSGYFSYGARTQFTSPGFVQLGYEPQALPPQQTTTAFMSLGTYNHGSMALSYTYQDFRDAADVELVGVNYSRSVDRLGYLTLSALRILSGDADTLFGLTFTLPLGERSSASFNGQTHSGSSRGTIELQQSLPAGSGVGYRLQAGLAATDPRQAGISLQNDVGTYSLDVAQSRDQRGYQGSMRGGIALLDGQVFLSRRINDSFAVVQVPGYADVRVYADNQQVASTDGNGYALIPQLRPYQKNPIRIEQADLPLDAEIAGLQIDAVPYRHGALALKFPVKHSRGAVLSITIRNGAFLPAGAEVTMADNQGAFPVGMRGEVYLTGLAKTNALHVTWQGQSCDLTIDFPDTHDPLPHLGPLTCPGMEP
jgi:outer membrane usher protein